MKRIIDPNRTARLLYERGDAAQRQAEAARELAERISRRRAA